MHYTEMYLQSQVTYYKEQVARVRELHKPVKIYGWLCCSYCAYVRGEEYQEYPCETIKALDGEQ